MSRKQKIAKKYTAKQILEIYKDDPSVHPEHLFWAGSHMKLNIIINYRKTNNGKRNGML